MSEFPIEDYQGVGCLQFGMNRQAIEGLMGPAARASTRGGGLRLTWEPGVITKLEAISGSTGLALCEIGLTRHCPNVRWQGTEPFGNLRAFAVDAARLDSAPLYGFGFLVLRDFGLAISGATGPVEDQAISVFCRGRWDKALDGMEPFKGF